MIFRPDMHSFVLPQVIHETVAQFVREVTLNDDPEMTLKLTTTLQLTLQSLVLAVSHV